MTLSTSINSVTYSGDGSTDAFAFSYLFFSNSHIKVYVDDVLQTETTDYNVTGAGNPSGGTITFTMGSIPTGGSEVIIQRVVPYTQETDLANFDGNPSDVTEKQFDLIVMQTQQLAEQIGRSILVTVGGDLTFPLSSADKLLAWSSSTAGTVVNTGFTATDIQTALGGIEALTAGSGVKVSSNDTTAGFLNGKLVAGSGITLTENNNGGNETLTVLIGDAELSAIAGLTSAADKLPYFTGSGTAALADLTAFARTLTDDATALAARATLGMQVVQTAYATAQTGITSTSYTDATGLTASITPATGDKIKISLSLIASATGQDGAAQQFEIQRQIDGGGYSSIVTNIPLYDEMAAGSPARVANYTYLDSPNTALQVDYKIRVKTGSAISVLSMQPSNLTSTIILEVK